MHPQDGRVVSNFIVQALRGEDITIYGDGMQTRSFCFVDDLIEGFLRFMDAEDDGKGGAAYPGPLNLGNPTEFTMLGLADAVIGLTGTRSRIIFKPLPSDDPMRRRPDISKARALLGGWEPKVELRVGLQRTIEYFDKLLEKT
jgi:UDP-glucuronate decarboxylase